MASTRDVAEHIITFANGRGRPVKNLDLQKIMYFCHARSLVNDFENPLIDNANIQKWRYGPVFPEIYHLYKTNGASPIINLKRRINASFQFTDFDITDNSLESDEREMVNEVVVTLTDRFESFELVEETHRHPEWLRDQEAILKGVQGIQYTNEGILQDFINHPEFRIWENN